ncbi:GNAT family N-acetyltransferase [Streptomyces sp. NPDC007875]|uniref:GNAT family N-acetyltransferase n=1 Tax=Streptomyces sp. NPDC007875 TaxID=3364783 RepID=UPI00368F0020
MTRTAHHEYTVRLATTGVRPAHPPHPLWLAERYSQDTTAQLVRVYVRPEHRRRGLARTLVDAVCDFIADTPGYDRVYLHTNVNVDGAEAFWRSLAKEVFDARTTGEHGGPGVATVHFKSRCDDPSHTETRHTPRPRTPQRPAHPTPR